MTILLLPTSAEIEYQKEIEFDLENPNDLSIIRFRSAFEKLKQILFDQYSANFDNDNIDFKLIDQLNSIDMTVTKNITQEVFWKYAFGLQSFRDLLQRGRL